MNLQEVISFYKSVESKAELELDELQKKININNWARGLSFLFGVIVSWYVFKNFDAIFGVVAVIVSLIVLAFFVRKSSFFKQKKEFEQNVLSVIKSEQKAIDYNFEDFNSGDEFINSHHNFSYDLDVFGENSIFQMLNRTKTEAGNRKLADFLQNPLTDAEKIIQIQQAIAELSNFQEDNIDYIANAKITSVEEKKKEDGTIAELADVSENVFGKLFWTILLVALPILSVGLFIATTLEWVSVRFYTLFSFAMLSIVGANLKYINKFHSKVSKLSKVIKKYSFLILDIEKRDFNSEHLKNLQIKLGNEKLASEQLATFAKLLNALDNRLNFVFAILSNSLVLWDIQVVSKIENWLNENSSKLQEWIDIIAEFEFLLSLSTFSFINPDYIFPEIDVQNSLEAKNIGHPLIKRNKLITNDFRVNNEKTFIITGANMAGKSTFIRTIGVNFILAQIGSAVCAEMMKFKPVELITSIRITDDLTSDESYFYAELKRLKMIIEKINDDKDFLIIIDEMLRGTNSIDKHKGSEGLLRKLANKNVISFLATHDVELGILEQEFPKKVKNYCFEAEIKNNELFFDYKLRQGTSKNLNASFLMKKMGII